MLRFVNAFRAGRYFLVSAVALSGALHAEAAIASPTNVNCNVVPGVQSQLTSEQQFTQIQIALTNQHLESLHSDDWQGPSSDGSPPSGYSAYQGVGASSYASAFPGMPVKAVAPPPQPLEYRAWSAGEAQFGTLNGGGLTNTNFSNYYGVIGLDRRFSSDLKVGVSFGAGSEHTTVNSGGSKTDNNIYTGTFYGSYRLAPLTYLDGQVGYGGGTVSSTRTIATDGSTVFGNRNSSDVFGSLALSHDFLAGVMRFSPYLRADAYQISLSGYSETGSALALSYGRTTIDNLVGVAGLRVESPIATSWGVLIPRLRFEYEHSFGGDFVQSINFATLIGGTPNAFAGTVLSPDQLVMGAGVRLVTLKQFSCDANYEAIVTSQGVQSQSGRLALSQKF